MLSLLCDEQKSLVLVGSIKIPDNNCLDFIQYGELTKHNVHKNFSENCKLSIIPVFNYTRVKRKRDNIWVR